MFRRTVDGQRLCVVQRKGESERKLRDRMDALVAAAKESAGQDRRSMKLARACELFLQYRATVGVAPRTLEDDQADARLLLKRLGHVAVGQIDPVGIDIALAPWIQKGQLRTAKKVRDFGRKLFNWCRAQKWASGDNPFSLSRPTGYEPDQWEEPMAVEDFERALAHVEDPGLRALLAVLRWTGQRPTAVRMLTWFEVEDDGETMRMRKAQRSSGSKNAAGRRPLLVVEPAASMVRALPRTSEFVFPSTCARGKGCWSERHVLDVWYRAQAKAGISRRFTLYDIKHMRATELTEALDRHLAAQAMNIKSPAVLERYYAQIDKRKLDERVRSIGGKK